jgi:hypothetical protein
MIEYSLAESPSSTIGPCGQRTEKDVIVNGYNVRGILDLFGNLGYICETNTTLQGKSGATHRFDIVAKRDSEMLVMDILAFRSSILDTGASKDESEERIWVAAVQMRAKGFDCQIYHSIILHLSSFLPGLEDHDSSSKENHERLEKLLRDLNIQLVRSSDIAGASKGLTSLLCSVEAVSSN